MFDILVHKHETLPYLEGVKFLVKKDASFEYRKNFWKNVFSIFLFEMAEPQSLPGVSKFSFGFRF
jgi:hypothetical protein